MRLFCENGRIEVLHDEPEKDRFDIDSSVKEVIVVHNSVVCLPTGDLVAAPTIIPHGTKAVQLPLPTGDENFSPSARLLVITLSDLEDSRRQRPGDLCEIPSSNAGIHAGIIKRPLQNKNVLLERSRMSTVPTSLLNRSNKVSPENPTRLENIE